MNRRFEITNGKCVIPDGVTEIPEDEFWECKELKEIVIPETVTIIPSGAFSYCTSLEKVCLPASVKEIQPQAFQGCSKLKSIEIPDGVPELTHSIFYRCASLKKIKIPKSVTRIHNFAFGRCLNLETIEVAEDNPTYKTESNCCLTKDGKTLVFGCKSSVIPGSVKVIKEFAFYGCTGLKSIRIPDGVEIIENGVFADCTRLTSINIPESVKLVDISFMGGAPIKEIYLSSKNPDDRLDLKEALKCHRLKDIDLHVPEESYYSYKNHPFFTRFRMIHSWNG